MLMEMNTIPKRHGWDEEKFMYYADAMGFAFIDSTAEGKSGERVTFNQYQVLDMSLGAVHRSSVPASASNQGGVGRKYWSFTP